MKLNKIRCSREGKFLIFEVGKPFETEYFDMETGNLVSNERETEFIITQIELTKSYLKVKFENDWVKCFSLSNFLNVNYEEPG